MPYLVYLPSNHCQEIRFNHVSLCKTHTKLFTSQWWSYKGHRVMWSSSPSSSYSIFSGCSYVQVSCSQVQRTVGGSPSVKEHPFPTPFNQITFSTLHVQWSNGPKCNVLTTNVHLKKCYSDWHAVSSPLFLWALKHENRDMLFISFLFFRNFSLLI